MDPDADPAQLVQEALDLFAQAETALEEGDLGTYQELTDRARARLERLSELGVGDLAPPAPDASTTTPTPTTAPG